MERKEPYATKEEYSKYVVHYPDVPPFELKSGTKCHIVSTERTTLNFASLEPNITFPVNQHEPEELMIVADGAADIVIEGKLYSVKKGDVIIFPPNIEHGVYTSNEGCTLIGVFSPRKQDLVDKLEEAKKSQKQ